MSAVLGQKNTMLPAAAACRLQGMLSVVEALVFSALQLIS
jgi:hypothetical protein